MARLPPPWPRMAALQVEVFEATDIVGEAGNTVVFGVPAATALATHGPAAGGGRPQPDAPDPEA